MGQMVGVLFLTKRTPSLVYTSLLYLLASHYIMMTYVEWRYNYTLCQTRLNSTRDGSGRLHATSVFPQGRASAAIEHKFGCVLEHVWAIWKTEKSLPLSRMEPLCVAVQPVAYYISPPHTHTHIHTHTHLY